MRVTLTIVVLLVVAVSIGVLFFRDRLEPAPPPVASAPAPAPAPPAEAAPGTGAGDEPGAVERAAEEAEEQVVREAQTYIEQLTEPVPEPVAVERADHFVTRDQIISLVPESSVETTTAAELAADPTLAPDAPLTVVREVEQVEMTTPEKIIAESGGDLDAVVRLVEDENVRDATVREVLERYASNPDQPITIVKNVRYFEITTPREIAQSGSTGSDDVLKVIRKPYRLEAATVAELLAEQRELHPDSVFYVRTVRGSDEQGIWGIVHDGLIENFARGMAIRRGEEINTYRVEIPRDADERLADESSSFLGRLIFDKTVQSYVYNFKENRMGRNPDRIVPGQEIVIINFEPDELISIYKHFLRTRG